MIKLNTELASSEHKMDSPELLDCYPDIDYEMLQIQQDWGQMSDSCSDPKQLAASGLKSMLKEAKQFEVIQQPDFNTHDFNLIKSSDKKSQGHCITISLKNNLTILLPIKQVYLCKKSAKYTKIILEDGQVLKTSVNFKKLKKCLKKYGFSEHQKSRLVRNKLKLHFPKIVNP